MRKYLESIKFHPVTAIFGLLALVVCAVLAAKGMKSDWMLATFAPCASLLGANLDQDCDNPRIKGYESIALIINRDEIDWSAMTYNSSNSRIIEAAPTMLSGKKPYVIYNPRITNPTPFNGTNNTFAQDSNDYTKTVQFYWEGIGGAAAKDVIEPLKSGSYLIILQRKDHAGKGSFPIVGLQVGAVATAQVQDEETGYWLITMTCNEPAAECEMLKTDYATTKGYFDTLLASA